jgi:tetratricopeptide (TPR) repeat protein
MSKLLEIFGKGLTVNIADLIWHWIDCVKDARIDRRYHQEFEEILDHLSQLDLASAEQKLRFYLFENPACACGRMAAAAICLHRECVEEAIVEFESVYVREPANTLALYAIGLCHERLGHEEQATEFYQDAIKFKRYLDLPRKRLAAIYFKNMHVDRALAEYEAIVSESPDDIDSLVLLGHLQIVQGRIEDAVRTFNRAILIHPDNFHVDDDPLINTMLRDGEFAQAIEYIESQIEADPDRADLYIRLGDVLSMSGNEQDAVEKYTAALQREPQCLETTVKLGACYLRTGSKAQAAREFSKALEINNEIVDAYIGLALAQHLAGKEKEAESTMSLAGAIANNSVVLFTQTAKVQFAIGRDCTENLPMADDLSDPKLFSAVVDHAARQAQSQHGSDTLYRFALLQAATGSLQAAAKTLETSLSLNPGFNRARTMLAVFTAETGDPAAAMQILSESNVLEQQTLEMHYKTAILFTNRRKFDAAVRQLTLSLSKNLADVTAPKSLNVVLQNLGLIDRSAALLECLAIAAQEQAQG